MDYVTRDKVDEMSGVAFEKYVASLLRSSGYSKVNTTPSSGDYGVDIIAYKDEQKYCFQCKRYSSNVGVKPIQEVYTGLAHYKGDVGVVITNSSFTPNAHKLAVDTGIQLWDRNVLNRMIKSTIPTPSRSPVYNGSSSSSSSPGCAVWLALILILCAFWGLVLDNTKQSQNDSKPVTKVETVQDSIPATQSDVKTNKPAEQNNAKKTNSIQVADNVTISNSLEETISAEVDDVTGNSDAIVQTNFTCPNCGTELSELGVCFKCHKMIESGYCISCGLQVSYLFSNCPYCQDPLDIRQKDYSKIITNRQFACQFCHAKLEIDIYDKCPYCNMNLPGSRHCPNSSCKNAISLNSDHCEFCHKVNLVPGIPDGIIVNCARCEEAVDGKYYTCPKCYAAVYGE